MKKRVSPKGKKNIYIILGLLAVLLGSLVYFAFQRGTREGMEGGETDASGNSMKTDGKVDAKVDMNKLDEKPADKPAAGKPAEKAGTEAAISGILTKILGKP